MTAIVKEPFTLKEIESILLQSHEKVKAKNINELSHYLPSDDGFRMHHFTLKKLKKENPVQLRSLLEKFILQKESPKKVNVRPRKQRAPKSQSLNLEASEVQELLQLAQKSDNPILVEKLRASLPFSSVKKEMLKCIREERVDMNLWNSYIEMIQARKN